MICAADGTPADRKPAEGKPADGTSAEVTPADGKPAEGFRGPAEGGPADRGLIGALCDLGPLDFRFAIWARMHWTILAIKKYEEIWMVPAPRRSAHGEYIRQDINTTDSGCHIIRLMAATYLS